MKFSYELYKKATLIWPLISCILGSVLIISAILYMFFSKSGYKHKLTRSISFVLLAIYLIVFNAPVLKYGIYLINENPNSFLVVEGRIDSIEEYSHSPKYTLESYVVYASIVTVDGEEYYFMTAENINIGENIEIIYLPNSHIVLEYKISD